MFSRLRVGVRLTVGPGAHAWRRLFYASSDLRAPRSSGAARRARAVDRTRWIGHPAVDVALVARKPRRTRAGALALAAGKHVIVEKPAFMCAADVDVVAWLRRRPLGGFCSLRITCTNRGASPSRVITAGDLGTSDLADDTKRNRLRWRADSRRFRGRRFSGAFTGSASRQNMARGSSPLRKSHLLEDGQIGLACSFRYAMAQWHARHRGNC